MYSWSLAPVLSALLAVVSLAATLELPVRATNIHTNEQAALGTIDVDLEALNSTWTPHSDPSISGPLCFSSPAWRSGECFLFYNSGPKEPGTNKGAIAGQFVVLVSEGAVEHVWFSPKLGSGISVAVVPLSEAPRPDLDAGIAKPAKKVVAEVGPDGETVETAEVVEDNRSWIQKNWMYIVPPLVLFLLLTPEDKKKVS